MRSFRLPLALAFISATGIFLYACGSDDSSGNTVTGGSDASTTTPDGSIATNDAAAPVDGSTPTDGSTPSKDGGPAAPPLKTCGGVTQVDTNGKVQAQAIGAVSFGGKYAFVWTQDSSLSGDGLSHLRARYFDGTAFTTEQDLGPGEAEPLYSGVDITGKAYFLLDRQGGTADRHVYDLTTGTDVSSSPISFRYEYTLTGLPHGAMALYQDVAHDQIADLYSPDGGWANGGDAGIDAGGFTPTNQAEEIQMAVNASGKGGAFWEIANAGGYKLEVAGFDGSHFSARVERDFPATTGGAASYFSIGALSNGDLVFAWNTAAAAGVTFATFHPSAAPGSQWDPDVTLATFTAAGNAFPLVLVDASDNITVLWTLRPFDGTSPGEIHGKRRMGGAWSADFDVGGAAQNPLAVLDPSGNVIALTQNSSNGPGITRMPANGTAFGPIVPTGLPSTSSPYLVIAFDAARNPVVAGWGTVSAALHLMVTTCAN